MSIAANIFGIERLRIETDGDGVRSLVCFSNCPLKCKYCINKEQMLRRPVAYTPESLLDVLKIDEIYFKVSSAGGITFGGGEPALHSTFIEEFRKLCPEDWTLYIETSLNVPIEHIERLSNLIDYWYIDIKDMNDIIYRNYTESSNLQVKQNLEYLIRAGATKRIMVRVPLIPGYNTMSDVDFSQNQIHLLGLSSEHNFTYKTQ